MVFGKKIRMSKLEIGVNKWSCMATVRVTLTNGSQSPIFGNKNEVVTTNTMSLHEDVTRIAMKCHNAIHSLRFYDKDKRLISQWE